MGSVHSASSEQQGDRYAYPIDRGPRGLVAHQIGDVVVDRRRRCSGMQRGERRLGRPERGVDHRLDQLVCHLAREARDREATVEQHERGHAVGVLRGQPADDETAHRVPDEHGPLDPGVVQDRQQIRHVRRHPVWAGQARTVPASP